MKRTLWMLGLSMIAAACGSQPEPERGPSPDGLAPMVASMNGTGMPSIFGIIGERQRLGLTSAQVTRLDSIAVRLSTANDSLRRSLRDTWDGEMRGERWERSLPVLEQIASNNRAAGLLVQSTLTEQQRTMACELDAEDRAERRAREPRRMQPRRMEGGRRQELADSIARQRAPEGWPWCPPPPRESARR